MASDQGSSSSSLETILERGRLALQGIRHREHAARCRAAASNLQAAILRAENGDAATLQHWLDTELRQLDADFEETQSNFDKTHSADEASTIQSRRIDSPSQLRAPSKLVQETQESPWAAMERGALERLEQRREQRLEQRSHLELRCNTDQTPVPEEHQINAISIQPSDENRRPRHWWAVSHVWISLVLHVVMVVLLSVFVITASQKPQLLSIVASSADSDQAMTESPMEMISEVETESEPMEALPAPILSDVLSEASLSDFAMQSGPNRLEGLPSSSLSGSADGVAAAARLGTQNIEGAEFFGAKAIGNTFVYVVDSSPSMRRDGAFEAARQEIVRSLASMKPKQRYFICFFGKKVEPMAFQLGEVEKYAVHAKPENISKTIDWLGRVEIQKEGWPPNNALQEAIAMQPDGIFLLFDGDTKSDVAKFLNRINRSEDIITAGSPKVPIHVIHFFQEEFKANMLQIANENGGSYRFVPRPERAPKR